MRIILTILVWFSMFSMTNASELGFELEDVATSNLKKLASRSNRGKISGEGDSR